jgi:D-alanine-D-alanine ligase
MTQTLDPNKKASVPTTLRKPNEALETLAITVLAGGPGTERAVSLDSGRAVAEALVRLGHRVAMRDIDPHDLSALDRPADFVFVALHGAFGEDGTLQAELDRRGLAYCGSGSAASRLAMHKVQAKRSFERAGIPTPPYVLVGCGAPDDAIPTSFAPGFVKPVSSGSSVDTTLERSFEDLWAAARRVADAYGEALVERRIVGPELTVGVLGEQALPVCEIRTQREFYDYDAKYVDDNTEYLFDLELPTALLERVQTLSVEAHHAVGCRVFSRVDWMVDRESLEPYVLEINTIPGFTSHSLLPKAAQRIGLDFDQLCQRIVELSLSENRNA